MLLTEIQPNRAMPLYRQIAEVLQLRIHDGVVTEGRHLGSEAGLGTEFGVSRITIRQALSELEQKALVERVPGKGTYVRQREPKVERITRLSGFGENMSALGLSAEYRTLEAKETFAPPEVSDRLGVAGRRAFLLERVLLADGSPVGMHVSYLPSWLVSNAPERFTRGALESGSLYTAVQAAGCSLARAEEIVEPVMLDASQAGKLDTHEVALALQVRRTVYESDERPVEYATIIYRTDAYTFRLELGV
ncbi:GntR family transcriptional regulator [Rubrobacter aplysinae]|uniref:GntR family transcriptional regulator n=1 Tax=Rubrobacter aplysinae TaxID=909625 RepID=UPI00069DF8D6|nr:GntR family transcriptional regulator [Rubrobacter aplysinae]